MKHLAVLSATLFGTAATVALVQPFAVAQNTQQVESIAKQVTVLIDGQAPGSGVIVAKQGQTYYVLTAAHVVPSPDEYDVVTPDGQRYKLDFNHVKKFPDVDLALVPFTSSKSYQVVAIGNSSQLKVGTPAYVTGFPAATEKKTRSTYRFTTGKIDARASRPLANGYGLAYLNDTFAGMSGGPIFDQQGQLIGIHGASQTPFGQNQGINLQLGVKVGLNLGIPVETFLRLVPQIASSLKFPSPASESAPSDLTASDFYLRGVEQVIAKNTKAALASFERAIRLQPDYAAAYFQRAGINSVSTNLRDVRSAITDYDRVIRLDPNYADAYNNRGASRVDLQDYRGAIADFDQAIRLEPNHANAHNNRGIVRFMLGDGQGAITSFSQAIQINPDFGNAYYNRGTVRLQLKDFRGALADYDQAIRLNPNLSNAFSNRGIARKNLRDFRGAITDYDQAIKVDPNNALAYNNRGNVYADSGNTQAAVADYRKAIELAQQQRNQQVYQQAVQSLKQLESGGASATRPNQQSQKATTSPTATGTGSLRLQSAQEYAIRGIDRNKAKDYQGAMADTTEAIRLDPKFAIAYLSRAVARDGLGDRPGAIADLQQAARLAQQQGNQQVYQLAVQTLRKLGASL